MAFTIPTFNLTCNIHSGSIWPPGPVRVAGQACNLSVGRAVRLGNLLGDFDTAYGTMVLLLPKGTDIRDASTLASAFGDYVECPVGSSRWYFATYVDDVGKGFANEFRFALLGKAVQANGGVFVGSFWPAPIP